MEGVLRRNVDSQARPTVEAVISGSLMTWACYREGSAAAWIRYELDAVLQPGAEGSGIWPAQPAADETQTRSRVTARCLPIQSPAPGAPASGDADAIDSPPFRRS